MTTPGERAQPGERVPPGEPPRPVPPERPQASQDPQRSQQAQPAQSPDPREQLPATAASVAPQTAQGRPVRQGPPSGQAQLGHPAAPATAVLDEAHLGDIEGALGRIKLGDVQQAGLKRKLITFLAIVGPG